MVIANLLGFGCGRKDKDTTETGRNPRSTPAALQGQWKTECLNTSVLDLTHTQREYRFNAIGDFDKYERFYSDDACTKQTGEYKVIGTVEEKGKAAEATDPSSKMINFTVNGATFKVVNDTALAFFNGLNLCGKSDWKLNEEAKVLDANCLGNTIRKGDVIFDIYSVKESQLYLGQSFIFLNKDSANLRPSNLDDSAPMAKQ